VPSTGALSQARRRLGPQPLQALFDRVAVPLARPGTPGAWLRSWRLMAIDGVMIDLPDTEANLGAYGKPEGGTRRPFPQLRVVGLSECGSHALVAAAPGTIYQFWLAKPGIQIPSATFDVSDDGLAVLQITAPAPVNQFDQVMVTIEQAEV